MPLDQVARAGRYVIGDEIASGGMATVHLGRMLGDAGFARTVAIKCLHAPYAKDPEVRAMLLDEGRLAARIHHLNVVTTLDVVATGGDLFIVMEYVHGEPLSALIRAARRRGQTIAPRICAAILAGALRGLHAAHEARDAQGERLGVVHRDVSPQNILVGSDGVARVLDFGVAKAEGRLHVTTDGRIKGKFGYMPPEQLHGEELDRRADVYAAGVVLWEALVGARLFTGRGDAPDFARLLNPRVEPPSTRALGLPLAYDAVALRALGRDPDDRFPTALAMAEALEACGPVAPPIEVGAWVTDVAGDLLAELSVRVAAVESRLVSVIRDSLYALESSDALVTRLDTLPPDPAPHSSVLEGTTALPSPPQMASNLSATADLPDLERTPRAYPPFFARGSALLWASVAATGAVALAAIFAVGARVPASPVAVASSAGVLDSAPPAEAVGVGDGGITHPAAGGVPPPPSSTAAAEPASSLTASTAPPPTSAPRARVTSSVRPTRPRPDACSPPYTLDAAGHRHYKRECLD